ncbi:MAG: hypothetical protein OXF84_00020, partial [Bacteroidetes bacterium]|nr:hypothetical protein [Bacteroidota bacterium]
LMMPALTLAGALALAGCGGGSDTPAAPPANNEEGGMTPPPEPAPKTLALPTGLTITGSANSEGATDYTIPSGGKLELTSRPSSRGDVVFTCPADGEDCVVTIPVGGAVSSVTYSGGTPEVTEKDAPETAVDTGVTERPAESTDPLSDDVLLKALKTGASRMAGDNTVWNAGPGAGTPLTNFGTNIAENPPFFTPLGGPRTELWIRGDGTNNNAAYYGIWAKSTQAAGNARVYGDRGVVWGGSTPYGKKPDTSLGRVASSGPPVVVANTAAYSGTGNVLLYHSTDGKASSWTEGTGDLNLTANFRTGMVGGAINVAANTGLDANDNIELTATSITSSGTFSGSAKFSDSDVKRQSGSWNGGFFGETLKVVGGNQDHLAPSHVAGQFSVTRTDTDDSLHLRGAFGQACGAECD